MIDVLGISLKGLDAIEAQSTSHTTQNLCWDNVLNTIRIASGYKNLRTIVTAVFTNENLPNRVEKFANILKQFPAVYMKVNNLQVNNTSSLNGLHKIQPELLYNILQDFVRENPNWKGRVILINNESAVEKYSSIIFL